jgi:hypothetical protein
MNTKRLIFLFPALFLVTIIFGQASTQQSITERLNQYFEATKAKDWDTVLDLLYPKLFELVAREDMRQLFMDMEGNGMELNMKDFEIRNISAPITYEAQQYALVDYNGALNIRFTSQAYQDPEVIGMLQKSLQESYGADNVKHLEADNSFDINIQKALYAISPEHNNEWTFIESDMEGSEALKQLIPASVKASLIKQ